MLKVRTVGMIEKNAKNNPIPTAEVEMKNGAFHIVKNGVAKLPTEGAAGAKQSADLSVAINTGVGDERYTEFKIAQGEFVNSFLLKAWEGQDLTFDESHITYGVSEDYSKITVNSTKLVAGTDGNLKIASDVTNYGVYLLVVQKLQFNGNAVSARIVLN